MKRVFKNRAFLVIITALICITGSVCATTILARDISYGNTNVESALNDLYTKANKSVKTCLYVSGTKESIGSKYLCDPGDGVSRYFYILKVGTNDVKLIMDRNISDTVGSNKTMNWGDAIHFFDENHPGYTTKTSWNNVIGVDLPSAQEIADASGMNNGTTTNWNIITSNSEAYFGTNSENDTSQRTNYKWLYNYTYDCKKISNCDYEFEQTYGYWSNQLVNNNESSAWSIGRGGNLIPVNVSDSVHYGVRPVITVTKNQLSN